MAFVDIGTWRGLGVELLRVYHEAPDLDVENAKIEGKIKRAGIGERGEKALSKTVPYAKAEEIQFHFHQKLQENLPFLYIKAWQEYAIMFIDKVQKKTQRIYLE